MDPVTIALLVVIVLALSSFGYGYYGAPAGGAPATWVNPVGTIAVILFLAWVVMLMTGWRFGMTVAPP